MVKPWLAGSSLHRDICDFISYWLSTANVATICIPQQYLKVL